MLRLYRAWSVVNNFRGRDQVRFNWFCKSRKQPVGLYADLIRNYDPASGDAEYDQMSINEYFGAAEIEQLRRYLRLKHHVELYTEEVELPAEAGLMPIGILPTDSLRDYYSLDEEEGYNLTISVSAFYSLEGSPETRDYFKGTPEEQYGVIYIRKAMDAMGYRITLDQAQLEDVVRAIFHQYGMWVSKK
ncbi:MAG: hypothetical protein ACM3UZ_00010 [Acidobacteriota bacterium]